MRCEEVREILPGFVGEEDPYPHEVEVHLATCPICAADEGGYRGVIETIRGLRFETEPLPPRFAEHVMARLTRPDVRLRGAARRLAHDPRARYAATRYAAASLGGVMVGAAAFALLRRRRAAA